MFSTDTTFPRNALNMQLGEFLNKIFKKSSGSVLHPLLMTGIFFVYHQSPSNTVERSVKFSQSITDQRKNVSFF